MPFFCPTLSKHVSRNKVTGLKCESDGSRFFWQDELYYWNSKTLKRRKTFKSIALILEHFTGIYTCPHALETEATTPPFCLHPQLKLQNNTFINIKTESYWFPSVSSCDIHKPTPSTCEWLIRTNDWRLMCSQTAV